ncbi:M20/M25/M40 family metallo-hydrolase [Paractinoplanes rishiriensis]|uniref:Peptidase M28 domain-containing protein n=1 Tax=Paractinoplanes rishiriensis TaxID=1050105 RepID=A0A919K617_9ACTN|nr:M20/M25/M40 family metallo-hydrolase [Actinoplanes rishiriensis]GIE99565.1 hypothetical protein Ari01nite_70300 [Actinoplanes rishiriensis]
MDTADSVVFFDLGDTLGTPVLSPPPVHLVGFQPFGFAVEVLDELRGRRLGIISNTGQDDGTAVDAVLHAVGLRDRFETALRIYSRDVGLRKDSPEIFQLAAGRAAVAAERCVFCGEDASERGFARQAGWRTAPHPLLVEDVLAGAVLRYLRITVASDWPAVLRRLRVVPLHVTAETVYAMAAERAVTELTGLGFAVQPLGEVDAPQHTDLYLFRDDATAAGRFGVADDEAGLIVALPAGQSPDDYHAAASRHGHHVRLLPDPSLLAPAAHRPPAAAALTETTAPDPKAFADLTGETIADRVRRYCTEPIGSRHVAHPGNRRAVDEIATEFAGLAGGRLTVRLLPFTHGGRTLFNVEATLPGESEAAVLVTAHLDATAMSSQPYRPERDPAPGADDDGSGLAAVLAIAERLAALLPEPPVHTLRFVLFNAEEQGLVGSGAYARQQRAAGADIRAVLQLDMIGFNRSGPRSWELHAGHRTDPGVESASRQLAGELHHLTALMAPELEPPQIYHSDLPGGDPADGRSDHSSFQLRGYPACLASEDFFAGPAGTDPEPNPDYHRSTDTFVDPEYAADIARVVAAAAFLRATTAP